MREGAFGIDACPSQSRLLSFLVALIMRNDANTAIEYALIAGGIALAIIAVVQQLGQQLNALFTAAAGLF